MMFMYGDRPKKQQNSAVHDLHHIPVAGTTDTTYHT